MHSGNQIDISVPLQSCHGTLSIRSHQHHCLLNAVESSIAAFPCSVFRSCYGVVEVVLNDVDVVLAVRSLCLTIAARTQSLWLPAVIVSGYLTCIVR